MVGVGGGVGRREGVLKLQLGDGQSPDCWLGQGT